MSWRPPGCDQDADVGSFGNMGASRFAVSLLAKVKFARNDPQPRTSRLCKRKGGPLFRFWLIALRG
jgi:hypothetical protein